MHKNLLLFLVALATAFPVMAEKADPLPYDPSMARKAAIAAASSFLGSGVNPFSIHVPALHPDLTSEIPGVKKTGIVYPLPSPTTDTQLTWEFINGHWVSRIQIVAENAKRLRLHVSFAGNVPPIEFRVQGSLDSAPIGPVSDAVIRNGEIWLPVTNGSNAELEISIAEDQTPAALGLMLDQVNLMVVDATVNSSSAILPQSLGLAQKPEKDLVCWSSNPAYPALQAAAAATAMVDFLQNGSSYVCSGTLLNDLGKTGTPWFATANHCIPDQATADTMHFTWLFQADACGSSQTDARSTVTSGGAELLWTDFYREPSFLKLNQPPGTNTVFSGWDTQISVHDPIWGVHHPLEDHTMVSQGTVTISPQVITDVSQGGNHILDEVAYTVGGTEDGSSGSGLFAVANGKAYWKGTLFGGPANYQISDYSHFQGYYDAIKKWLDSCALPWGGSIVEGDSVTAYAASTSINCAATSEIRSCAGGTLSGSHTSKTCTSSAMACSLPWGGSIANGKTVTAYQSAENIDCAAIAQSRTCTSGTLSGSYTYSNCVSPQACPAAWDGSAPVADPGDDGTANVGDRFRLDGSHSCNSAPPGAKKGIRYAWKRRLAPTNADGSPAKFNLRRASTAKPSFVPPLPGDYVFQLTVASHRLASQPKSTTVHVGGTIQVSAPTDHGEWTLGGDKLRVIWTFSGINPNKRFNLFLLTDVGAASSKSHLLQRNIKPVDPVSGDYLVALRRSARNLKLRTAQAAIKVCIPPVGNNEPVCGTSGVFAVR